jgi:hypothetical protein
MQPIRYDCVAMALNPGFGMGEYTRDNMADLLRRHGINPTHQRIEIAHALFRATSIYPPTRSWPSSTSGTGDFKATAP